MCRFSIKKWAAGLAAAALLTGQMIIPVPAAEILLEEKLQYGSIGGEWAVIAAARSGTEIPDETVDGYLDSVEQALQSTDGILDSRKYTENSRVTLALAALGENPQDFRGYDVLEPLKDTEKVRSQGINGSIWALIAADSGDYDGLEETRETLLTDVLNGQNEDGGYSLIAGDSSDADLTAMALTALSAHEDNESAAAAIEKGSDWLKEAQEKGFESCESWAQATVAWSSLVREEEADTARNALDGFAVDGGYCHEVGGNADGMATEQALYAIAAYERMENGSNRLFDMRDDGTLSCTISISCETLLNNEKMTEDKKVLVPDDGWILAPTETEFSEGDTVFDVLYQEVRDNKIHMEYEKTPLYNSVYIEGIGNIYEFDAGEESGWMFRVNGEFPNYGCSAIEVENGDVIEWVYTCDLGADVGSSQADGESE